MRNLSFLRRGGEGGGEETLVSKLYSQLLLIYYMYKFSVSNLMQNCTIKEKFDFFVRDEGRGGERRGVSKFNYQSIISIFNSQSLFVII